MSKQRKQYTEEFKATVALDAMTVENSLQETGRKVWCSAWADKRMERFWRTYKLELTINAKK